MIKRWAVVSYPKVTVVGALGVPSTNRVRYGPVRVHARTWTKGAALRMAPFVRKLLLERGHVQRGEFVQVWDRETVMAHKDEWEPPVVTS